MTTIQIENSIKRCNNIDCGLSQNMFQSDLNWTNRKLKEIESNYGIPHYTDDSRIADLWNALKQCRKGLKFDINYVKGK